MDDATNDITLQDVTSYGIKELLPWLRQSFVIDKKVYVSLHLHFARSWIVSYALSLLQISTRTHTIPFIGTDALASVAINKGDCLSLLWPHLVPVELCLEHLQDVNIALWEESVNATWCTITREVLVGTPARSLLAYNSG